MSVYSHKFGAAKTKVIEPAVIREFLKSRDPLLLMETFAWSTSPQGSHYWSSRYNADETLSKDDMEFVLAVLLFGRRR